MGTARKLIAFLVILTLPMVASSADDAPLNYNFGKRLTAVEKDVAALKADVAALKGTPAVAAAPVAKNVVVPPGSHAHLMADGTTMIHSNANQGNAAAHAGVVSFGGVKWPKTATAGQVVTTTTAESVAAPVVTTRRVQRSVCQNGVCRMEWVDEPIETSAGTFSTMSYSESYSSGRQERVGPFRAVGRALFGGGKRCKGGNCP